jgi:hypothetical protein
VAQCSAEIVVKLDGRGYREKVIRVSADSLKQLKHRIYMATFEDLDGENAADLKQWYADNDIKPRRKA